ncbi:MAG: bifunctional methylenetetrahydrofolate dehydrogenase/methenyltetrahydrofolate cyclohydrolase FolD [Myxococcales bacterium]|nr:bifunctional methylenetetrahydrofolate dehydrogenase/methenyltetrahydrofolate cyclohydrolase FolD [Myxococcales bacterium]
MTARILNGKAAAEAYRTKVAEGVAAFVREHGRAPGLEVVMVGDDPASDVYTRNKKKAAEAAGIRGVLHRLPAETSEAELLLRVAALNADPAVDGILVQLPLPRHIDPDRVIDAIDCDKDVDGFTPKNAGLLASGRPNLVACTPKGCMHLLELAGTDLLGARALVIGRSNIVGKPMAQLLLARHATVTIAHSRSRDLADLCREADVLVAAVGRARMVKGDWVKPGAVVIDVGMNRDADGKLCGDVDTAAAAERAAAITPVPGGVGPMTIACLLDITLLAARHRAGAVR